MAVLAGAALTVGCTRGPLLERAIRARGGPLHALARSVQAEVNLAYPGRWESRFVFLLPDRYAWTIVTVAEPDHYLFDGEVVRAFVGPGLIAVDPSPDAPLRSHALFTAVLLLDALRRPGVRLQPLAAGAVPAGAREALEVVLPDVAEPYRLAFDADAQLVRVEGPLDLPPIGRGTVTADLSDFRTVGRWRLPHRIVYRVGGQVVADERVVAMCPEPPGLADASFRSPSRLPPCP